MEQLFETYLSKMLRKRISMTNRDSVILNMDDVDKKGIN